VFIAHESRWDFQTNEFDDLVVPGCRSIFSTAAWLAAGVLP
jgi:hypothetical protein